MKKKKLSGKRRRIRGRWRGGEGGEDGAEGCDKRRRKGGQSRKRGKWKMHFFFLCRWCTCARNCVFALSHFQIFFPMEIRHPSVNMYVYVSYVCMCIRVYSWSALCMYVYRCNELVLCLLCVMYTRVNICVLRDNDFSGITL